MHGNKQFLDFLKLLFFLKCGGIAELADVSDEIKKVSNKIHFGGVYPKYLKFGSQSKEESTTGLREAINS